MRIAVLGIGNILARDDAFGAYVAKVFESQFATHTNVFVTELGTPGMDLVPHLSGFDALILIDTVKAKAEPGTLHVYDKQQILKHAPNPRDNAHDPGLKDTLLMMELTGDCPREITLIGCVPELIETGTGLSEALMAAVPQAVAHVEVALAMLGYPPAKRPVPLPLDVWWDRQYVA